MEVFANDSLINQIIVTLASKKRNVYEEVLMIDEIDLVGSLGGSLGLFVGFSLFDSLSLVLECVLKKFKCP